jgi:hypothetical protein
MISMERRCTRASACGAVLCALGVACWALADPAPGEGAPPPPAPTTQAAPAKPVQPALPADDGGCGAKGAEGKVVPATPAASGDVPPAQGPPPAWTCEAATVTLPPVWTGASMTATWVVKNGGTGDLVIKLKGG